MECNSQVVGGGIINISKSIQLLNSSKFEPKIEFLINGNESDLIVGDNEDVNISVRILEGDGEASLFENGTLIGKASPNLTIIKKYEPGTYNITLHYPGSESYLPYSKTIFIFVEDSTPPKINVLSPQNKTYYTTSSTITIKLSFSVNEEVSWIAYSLDDSLNTTLSGNTTLVVPLGTHKIILYAKDLAGNVGSSNEILFSVKKVSGGGGGGCRCFLI